MSVIEKVLQKRRRMVEYVKEVKKTKEYSETCLEADDDDGFNYYEKYDEKEMKRKYELPLIKGLKGYVVPDYDDDDEDGNKRVRVSGEELFEDKWDKLSSIVLKMAIDQRSELMLSKLSSVVKTDDEDSRMSKFLTQDGWANFGGELIELGKLLQEGAKLRYTLINLAKDSDKKVE
jgi:hypothetical protein